LLLQDDHNYGFSGQLEIDAIALKELSDPVFDWSELTTDLQGHSLDPVDDVDSASVVVFRDLSEEDVEWGLSTNTLDQSSVALFVSLEIGSSTQAQLSDFTLFGNDVDVEQYFEEGYGTWLLTLNTGTEPGVGTRIAAFISPSAEAEDERLDLVDGTASLTVDASLTGLTGPAIPAQDPEVIIDWSKVLTDGQGGEFQPGSIDLVTIGRYDDMSAEELEADFLDLELLADEQWELHLYGTEAALGELSNETGNFPGVEPDSTWVLALRCSLCTNPAPPFLTLLETCP
jgi:hypothetical protein